MGEHRKKRVSELLREFLAVELGRCGDPRLGSVTVTAVDMSNDLTTAWVYWAVHPAQLGKVEEGSEFVPDKATAEAVASAKCALEGAMKLLRRRIGENIPLRHIPVLRFKHDESLDRGMRIDHLLSKL